MLPHCESAGRPSPSLIHTARNAILDSEVMFLRLYTYNVPSLSGMVVQLADHSSDTLADTE